MIFKGSAVALVTPFDENGNVNFDKIKTLGRYSKLTNLLKVFLQKSGGKAHDFNRGMKAKKLFAIIGQ